MAGGKVKDQDFIGKDAHVRHREEEFTDPVRHPREELLARFHEAVEMVARTLEAQDAASFTLPVAGQPPFCPKTTAAVPPVPDELV